MTDSTRINTFENFNFKSSQIALKQSRSLFDKRIGWFCTYTPEEIITASGFIPARITGKEKAKKAEGYFPINFCPFIKSAMEDLLSLNESENNVSGLIFTNSCDGMRRFYDLCCSYLPSIPSFMLDVPRIKNSLSVKQFAKNIQSMAGFLKETGGQSLNTENLKKSLEIHIEKRNLLIRLHSLYKKSGGAFGTSNYFSIINHAMNSEPQAFCAQLKEYLAYAEAETDNIDKKDSFADSKENIKTGAPPVMIIGNFIDEVKLWEILDDLGCRVLATDTCSSERYFGNISDSPENIKILEDVCSYNLKDIPENKNAQDLITDISLRHLLKPQCMRMANLGAKIAEINEIISKNKIRGVIFISQKFCDNTLLFYPLLRDDLNILKVPSLFLEIEHNNLSSGQIKTRIQAFLEII